jgi:hypothetical protein
MNDLSTDTTTFPSFATLYEQLLDEGQLVLTCPTHNVSAVRRAMTYAKQAYNRRMKEDGDSRRIFTDLYAEQAQQATAIPHTRILFTLDSREQKQQQQASIVPEIRKKVTPAALAVTTLATILPLETDEAEAE